MDIKINIYYNDKNLKESKEIMYDEKINRDESKNFKKVFNQRVIILLNSKNSNAYKKIGKTVYRYAYSKLYDEFKISSYHDIKKCDFEKAIKFAKNFEINDESLKNKINELNNS